MSEKRTAEGNVFSDQEAVVLLRRFIESAGREGMDEPEIMRLMEWAVDCRLAAAELKLVMDGRIRVRCPEGDDVIFYPIRTGGLR